MEVTIPANSIEQEQPARVCARVSTGCKIHAVGHRRRDVVKQVGRCWCGDGMSCWRSRSLRVVQGEDLVLGLAAGLVLEDVGPAIGARVLLDGDCEAQGGRRRLSSEGQRGG